MITVIVPVYKAEKYLRECVASIVHQTYRELQIILVDDGSPDDCGRICEALAQKDSRIYVLHQENSGQSTARNYALSWALERGCGVRGNYFAFVDSDDTIEPGMYRAMVDSMSEDIDLVICGHRTVYEGEPIRRQEVQEKSTEELDADALWQEVFGRLNNAVWNKLYRAELIKDICFPERLRHGEDLLFNLEYLTRCHAGRKISTEYYNYLKRKDSVTTSKFGKTKLLEITSKDLARDFVKKNHPALKDTAETYCFRARMNVLRGIYRTDAEKAYAETIDLCTQYVFDNYPAVRASLRPKERVEFMLFHFFRPIYALASKCTK